MAKLLINIDVDDLDRAIAFYANGLGLRLGRRLGPTGVEMLGGEAPIYLLLAKAGSKPIPGSLAERSYQRHWTPVHLDFAVDEIESAVLRAERAGANLEQPVAVHKWGKLALLSDPFGNGFCLLQFTGRGYEEIAT